MSTTANRLSEEIPTSLLILIIAFQIIPNLNCNKLLAKIETVVIQWCIHIRHTFIVSQRKQKKQF